MSAAKEGTGIDPRELVKIRRQAEATRYLLRSIDEDKARSREWAKEVGANTEGAAHHLNGAHTYARTEGARLLRELIDAIDEMTETNGKKADR